MDFNISENSTDTRYFLTVEFTQPILPFLTNGTFNISIKDMLMMTTINIDSLDVLLNQYGLTVPYRTSIQDQLDNSLINNKGIVITIPNDNTLSFTMIPRCMEINTNKIIGFYDSMINIHAEYNAVTVDVNTTAKLYPRLVRSDTLDKYAPEPDPVLPSDVDRCCYTYPDIYQDSTKKITHNVVYNTDSEFYANSTTSANTPPEEVPSYVSKLSAYFTAEEADGFIPDWKNAVSWLYNDRNKSHVDVDWECLDEEPTVYNTYVVGNSDDVEIQENYWLTISAYQINQYVFAKNLPPNRYENKLFFGLSAEHIDIYPPLEPVHELYMPDTLIITPVNPTYVFVGDDTHTEYPCPTRVLEINDYSLPPIEQDGVEHFEINLDPNGNGHNAFLFSDPQYKNIVACNLNVRYFDVNNNMIPHGALPWDSLYGSNGYNLPDITATNSIIDVSISAIENVLLHYDNIDHAVVSAHIEVELDSDLVDEDSETHKVPIEEAPYWISRDYALTTGWRYIDSVQTIWNKYEHPAPVVEYRAPAQINMNILPQYASVNNPSWQTSPNRILNVNANTPDDIEFGRELLTISINPSNLNNFITSASDRLDVTYYINYPGSHRGEDATLTTTFGTEPVPETYTLSVPADTSEPLTANINLSGELDEDATITIAAELVLYDPNGTREQEIKDRYHVDLSMLPDWNKIPAVTLNWTRRYTDPFIPDPWTEFDKYVIFTQSELDIDNSYIGVKSITAPCVKVNNGSIVESELFITGKKKVQDTTSACLAFINANTTKTLADGRHIDYTSATEARETTIYGGQLRGSVNALSDYKVHIADDADYPEFTNTNPSYIGNIVDNDGYLEDLIMPIEEPPELVQLDNMEFIGEESIIRDTDATINLDASVNNHYDVLQCGDRGIINLKKGTYYFNSVTLGVGTQINIENNLGDNEFVRIFVRGDFNAANTIDINNPNVNLKSFMIYSHEGNIDFAAKTSNNFNYGIAVAPGKPDPDTGKPMAGTGEIRFHNSVIWTGALWAQKVDLQGNCEVHSYGN
jgi:hypothetical protein